MLGNLLNYPILELRDPSERRRIRSQREGKDNMR